MEIQTILESSFSRRDFFDKLESEGHVLHRSEDGVINGIQISGQVHSFNDLGIPPERLEDLDRIQSKIQHNVHKRLKRIEEELNLPKLSNEKTIKQK
jgi:hypothetical protein